MKYFVRNILIVIIILLILLVCYQKYCYDKIVSGNIWKSNEYVMHEYYCQFTKTYRVVSLLNDYSTDVPEWSYIVVDQFQDSNVIVLKIPSKIKKELVEGKYYEFRYMIVGNGSINSMDDINKYITLDEVVLNKKEQNIKVYLIVEETVHEGLEQVQENICQNTSVLMLN